MPSQAIRVHASAIAESRVAPTLFRHGFSHSLDPQRTFIGLRVSAETGVRKTIRLEILRGIAPNKISALSRIGAAPKARITIGGGIPLGELVIGPSVVEPPQTGDRHRHHGKAHPYFTAP